MFSNYLQKLRTSISISFEMYLKETCPYVKYTLIANLLVSS